jgi:type I restriction enzyme R subunit
MPLHTEIEFERDICQHLAAHGWLYAEPGAEGDARGWDTPRALYPPDVLAWLQATQPDAWAHLSKLHGGSACARRWTSRARWRCCATASSWWG